jgi:hypothetical protein
MICQVEFDDLETKVTKAFPPPLAFPKHIPALMYI